MVGVSETVKDSDGEKAGSANPARVWQMTEQQNCPKCNLP